MSEEPFFIRQTDEPRTGDERLAWLKACIAESGSEGFTFSRFSHHPVTNVLLFEAWKEHPHDQAGLSEKPVTTPRVALGPHPDQPEVGQKAAATFRAAE